MCTEREGGKRKNRCSTKGGQWWTTVKERKRYCQDNRERKRKEVGAMVQESGDKGGAGNAHGWDAAK